jgi:thioredoxin 1
MKKIKVIDFYADWCNPCKVLAPIIEEAEKEFTEVEFVKVNVDENPEMAAIHGVRAIPTLVFTADDEVVNRKVGNVSKDQISEIIKEIQG